MSNLSPRYVQVGSDGRILYQSDTMPFEIPIVYPNLQRPITTNNNQHPTIQSSKNNQWWSTNGQFNPYRTTYQDYGPTNHKTLLANIIQ